MIKGIKQILIFQYILRCVQKHPITTLFLSSILIIISLWGLKSIRLELDIYDVYEPSFPSSIDLATLRDSYQENSQVLILFEFEQTPQSGDVCHILKWASDLASTKGIKSVVSPWSIRVPEVKSEKIWYPSKLSDPCEKDSLRPYVFPDDVNEGPFRYLFSSDNTRSLVLDVSLSGNESNTIQVERLMKKTSQFLKTLKEKSRVRYLGPSSSRYYFREIILKDTLLSAFVILILLLSMRLFYGTWLSGIILSSTLIFSSIVLYGLISLFGMSVNILTSNLFLMTAVAGTADFMFVTHHQLKHSYQRSLEKLIAPCFFTTLTTVIGFISLNTSELKIIRDFGNGAAIGAITEWSMLFILLPALLKILKREIIWVDSSRVIRISWIDKLDSLRLHRSLIWLLKLLMFLSIPSFFFLNDYDSPIKNLPPQHELRLSYESFQKKFSWEGLVYLYFPERPSDRRLKEISFELKNSSFIYHLESPLDLSVSWTKDHAPLTQDLLRRELSMSPAWNRYYSAADELRIPIYLYQQDLHTLKKVRDIISRVCKGECRIAGQRVVYLEYGEKITRTMIESFALSITLVVGILFCILSVNDKIRYFIPVTISALLGPLVTLTLMAVFQIPVTLVTSIFLAVMVGLAGDNAIQFIMASDQNLEEGIAEQSIASICITLVMIAGSLLFTIQTLEPMRMLGYMFIIGFSINLFGDLWGLKTLLTEKGVQNP